MKDSSEGSGVDCERPSTEKIKTIGRLELMVIRWSTSITALVLILASILIYFRYYPFIVKRFQLTATPQETESFRIFFGGYMFGVVPLCALLILVIPYYLGRPVKPDLADQLERN
jgi:hypothetical protein